MISTSLNIICTPSGRSIQKPYAGRPREAYWNEVSQRSATGALPAEAKTKVFHTLQHGRTIYGGGGVMPDIFVPVDTTEYSTYYRDMTAKGILNQYAIKYVDKNRKAISKQFKTVKDFDNGFTVSDEMMRDFIAMGEQDSVKYDEEKYRTSEQLLKDIIKGLIARDVYGDQSAYSVIINHRNRDLQAAIAVLNDPERFQRLLHEGNPEYERLVKKSEK